ncbi:MAG TPA: dephospho-CoA kinase [Campylobacterales bacterium]|nr:dephospho-CoA kinase [Campylobacterales bacterium]
MVDPFAHAIVLTGGIGTGKSTVCNILKLYGFSIIDADKIANYILQKEKDSIIKLFGKKYIKDNSVDKKALAKLIFKNKDAKQKLENLMHPLIKKKIIEESLKLEKHKVPYIIDIPLFFETKNYPIKRVAVVYAPKELQIQRVVNRDKLSYEEAIERIESQLSIEKKKEKATYLIDNSKDLKNLQKEIDKFVEKVKDEFSKV